LQPLWELSSAGSEHLPYKQGVAGSNPAVPTRKTPYFDGVFAFILMILLKCRFRASRLTVGRVAGSNPAVPTRKTPYSDGVFAFIPVHFNFHQMNDEKENVCPTGNTINSMI
jgi:hypothetical protein